MSDAQTLLPPNATRAERALEMAMRANAVVQDGISTITTLKDAPPEQFLRWLVWEYGLEDLLPFLPSARDVIGQGIRWQRIKGTPESLHLALSWLDYGEPAIEENKASMHWPEFMIDPGGLPEWHDDLRKIGHLAALSAPVGTRLSRIFHGHDVRLFLLDGSRWGNLLSDHSGVRDDDLGLMLSFGRTLVSSVALDDTAESGDTVLTRAHSSPTRYEDRPLLDFSRFGDAPLLNHLFLHTHLFQIDGQGLHSEQISAIRRVLPQAAIVLSDGHVLGDTNATLFATEYRELGALGRLSDGLVLSGTPWRIEARPIDERIDRTTHGHVDSDFAYVVGTAQAALRTSFATNVATSDSQARSVIDMDRTSAVRLAGQYWTGIPWVAVTWDEIEFDVRTKHHGDPA